MEEIELTSNKKQFFEIYIPKDCDLNTVNRVTVRGREFLPVVHGEWIVDGMNEYELSYGCIGYEPRYRCSNCGITTESYLRTEKPIMPEDADFPMYCQYCGAKMDGKEKRDE